MRLGSGPGALRFNRAVMPELPQHREKYAKLARYRQGFALGARLRVQMLDEQADDTLAMAAANGDRDAFGQLLERHYDRIYRLAWRLLGNETAAEDLAQEVAIALPRKLRNYRGEARFTTWLYRVVMNAGRDAMRANARQARLMRDFTVESGVHSSGHDPQPGAIAWLRSALTALKPDLRETAALVLDQDLTHAEAAKVLGVKESTISWRLSERGKVLKEKAKTEQGSL